MTLMRSLLLLSFFSQLTVAWVSPVRSQQRADSRFPLHASLSSSSMRRTDRNPAASETVEWDWRAVAKAAFENSTTPIVLFDGVCNFCNAGVNFCLDHDEEEGPGNLRYASLQSTTGQALLMQHGKRANDISSIVLVVDLNKAYFQSDAVLGVASRLSNLPMPVRTAARVARRIVPRGIRDMVYELVAANRYVFGERDSCRVDWDHADRFVQDP